MSGAPWLAAGVLHVVGGVGGWLMLAGLILRPYHPALIASVRGGCEEAALALNSFGDRLRGALRAVCSVLGSKLESVFSVLSTSRRPAPAGPPFDEAPAIPALVAALGLLGVGLATNYALLRDIVPDLLNLSPRQREGGLGWWMTLVSPAVIAGGELVGGILSSLAQRPEDRKRRRLGRITFLSCLAFELAAALRRASEFALGPQGPYEVWGVSLSGLTTALTYVGFAVVLPAVIFCTAGFLEPWTRGLSLRAVKEWVALLLRGVAPALAVVALALALVGSVLGIATLIVLTAAVSFLILWVVLPATQVAMAVLLLLPGAIVAWVLRQGPHQPSPHRVQPVRRRGLAALGIGGMVLLLMVGMAPCMGCGRVPTAESGRRSPPVREVEAVRPDERQPALDVREIEGVRPADLERWLRERVHVKRLEEPSLLFCIADCTHSISEPLRGLILADCSRRTALAPPEATAVLVLVTDFGEGSELPLVVRRARLAATGCCVDPPLPRPVNLSTLLDRRLETVAAELERQRAACAREVAREREAARRQIAEEAEVFVCNATAKLENAGWGRTALIQTLARCAEFAGQLGGRGGSDLSVRVDIVSDGIDDVSPCEEAPDPLGVECRGPAYEQALEFVQSPGVEVRFFQVRVAPPPGRSPEQWERQRLDWQRFWRRVLPGATFYTWTPGLEDDALAGGATGTP